MIRYSFFLLLIFLFPVSEICAYGDLYIDRVTGMQLGSDGSETNNLRVIDIREWIYVLEEKGGPDSIPGIEELHRNSHIISFNEDQIQEEIQKVADDTMRNGIENQVFIVLNVNNGKVYAIRDWVPELQTNTEIIISTYGVGPNSAPRVGEGLMLLAQLHSHPKELQDNRKNVRTVSEHDIKAAMELGINIFAIDAFTSLNRFESRKSIKNSRALYIHKVSADGIIKKFIGQTYGKNGMNAFNFSAYFNLVLRKEQEIRIL